MKIVHLCLASFYPDGYAYQENLLPKFHKELGYDVEVIASTQSFDAQGRVCFLNNVGIYQNEYDIKVTRLPYKFNNSLGHKLKQYTGTYSAIEKARPDILFIHGCQFLDVLKLIRYFKTHPKLKVYVDNHADFSNSATNWLSKNILHQILWKYCAQVINPYVCKFYGVLPVRVDFLKNIYNLPEEKCELLVMGADDEIVEKVTKSEVIYKIRRKYGITQKDFLVVTGGKINKYRPETLHLMKAVADSSLDNIKLLVFGNVDDTLKPNVDELCRNSKIVYAGWQNVEGTYSLMAAADLVVFPGLHSVMWEQAVALGVPCVFRDIEGFHHVDLGGNALFLKDVSKESLQKVIEDIAKDKKKHEQMRSIAKEKGMRVFSYYEIARRSIEMY